MGEGLKHCTKMGWRNGFAFLRKILDNDSCLSCDYPLWQGDAKYVFGTDGKEPICIGAIERLIFFHAGFGVYQGMEGQNSGHFQDSSILRVVGAFGRGGLLDRREKKSKSIRSYENFHS